MAFPRRLLLTVGAVLAIALAGAYLLRDAANSGTWVPLGLAIGSLAVSIIAAFRSELFGFAPAVVGGETLLAQTQPPSTTFNLVLPLHFLNRGYGDGVVEWVAVRLWLHGAAEPILLTPVCEIDMMKLIQGKRHLHAENVKGSFAAFPLEGKKSVSKAILFKDEVQPGTAAPVVNPGRVRFEIYVKGNNAKKAKLALTIVQGYSQEMLASYATGTSIHNVQRPIVQGMP